MSKIAIFTSLILLDILQANIQRETSPKATQYRTVQPNIAFNNDSVTENGGRYNLDYEDAGFNFATIAPYPTNEDNHISDKNDNDEDGVGLDDSDDDYYSFNNDISFATASDLNNDSFIEDSDHEDDIDVLFAQLSNNGANNPNRITAKIV